MEVFWDIRRVDGVLSLDIVCHEGWTCRLTPDPDGGWRGRWENFEKMPVELRPARSPADDSGTIEGDDCANDAASQIEVAAAASRLMEAVDRLTETRHLYRRTGYDSRPMEFQSDGSIGAGSGRLETRWRIHQRQGDISSISATPRG